MPPLGVDQYISSHVFEALPDGGRIVLQRDRIDSAGTSVIRAHLRNIAARFSGGDFSIPGMVHAHVVPGTVDMAARRNLIRYVATLSRAAVTCESALSYASRSTETAKPFRWTKSADEILQSVKRFCLHTSISRN